MANPRKAVTAEEAAEQVLRIASGYQRRYAHQHQASTYKMQAALGFVAVLGEVKRVKGFERFKGFGVLHGCFLGFCEFRPLQTAR